MRDRGQRSESVRRANLSALVRALHAEGPLSRSELGERTGLTRSGIRRLVGDLVAAGLVVEERGESLGAARPPVAARAPRSRARRRPGAGDRRRLARRGRRRAGRSRLRPRPRRPAARPRHASTTSSPTSPSSPTASAAHVAHATRSSGSASRSSASSAAHDGFVSTAPNLGWRDVPLGDGARRRARRAGADRGRQRGRPRRPRRAPARRRGRHATT